MRKLLFLSVVASVALAQGKPPVVTRPPAAAPARDAGVAPVRVSSVDAGVPAAAPAPAAASGHTPEVEKLRKEVNELKLRTADLERQLAKADTLNGELEKLNTKVDDLKAQLKQVSDAEQRRADAEEAVVTRKTQTAAASSNLNAVLVQLMSGNTSGIEPSLRYAESVFTGAAQKDVQLARAALVQGDVAAARQLLMLALIELDSQR